MRKSPLIDLFKDLFSWLPLYSYIDAGKSKIIVMHGGISDKINLKKLNSLARNKCEQKTNEKQKHVDFLWLFDLDVSIEVPPESKSGGKKLTEDEENEYHQIQGKATMKTIIWLRKRSSQTFFGVILTLEVVKVVERMTIGKWLVSLAQI